MTIDKSWHHLTLATNEDAPAFGLAGEVHQAHQLAFCSTSSTARRSLPMSPEKSDTDSRLRSPEMTTSSYVSVMALWTLAPIASLI